MEEKELEKIIMSNEKLLQSDISYLVTIIPELHTFYRPFFNIDGDNIAINTFPNYEKLGKYFAKENGLDISDYNILENYIDYYGVKETLNITKTIQKKIKLLLNSDNE